VHVIKGLVLVVRVVEILGVMIAWYKEHFTIEDVLEMLMYFDGAFEHLLLVVTHSVIVAVSCVTAD
jgi:hypothetical protein